MVKYLLQDGTHRDRAYISQESPFAFFFFLITIKALFGKLIYMENKNPLNFKDLFFFKKENIDSTYSQVHVSLFLNKVKLICNLSNIERKQ